jgi:DNA-binding MarR family transcriptional regulator
VISATGQGGGSRSRAAERPPFLDSTWYLLARTGSLAHHHWAAMIADFDVSPSQYKVLMTLGEIGPIGQQDLAELIGVDPRNAGPIVESLVERGLIEREVDPADRRRRMLGLTWTGRGVCGDLAAVGAELESDILRPLPLADQARLRQMMLAIHDTPADPV